MRIWDWLMAIVGVLPLICVGGTLIVLAFRFNVECNRRCRRLREELEEYIPESRAIALREWVNAPMAGVDRADPIAMMRAGAISDLRYWSLTAGERVAILDFSWLTEAMSGKP